MGKAQLVEPAPDPARAALGAAIRERDMRARDFEAAKAVERATVMVDAAEVRHGLARAGLARWRTNQVEKLHAAAATGEAPVQESAREARAAAQDAADEIESAKSVLVDCEVRASEAKDESEWATRNVESLVAPVLTAEVGRLLIEAMRLRSELHGKYAVLVWLRDLLPFGGEERQRVSAILPPPAPPGVREVEFLPPVEWIAARQALLLSADAPLPSTP